MKRLIFCLVCCFSTVFANNSLYETRIKVPNESAQTEQKAFSQGLKQILERTSGAAIDESEANAEKYVDQFHYEQQDGQNILVMRFNKDRINTWLKEAGLSAWTQSRPLTLSFIALMSDKTQSIAQNGEQSELTSAFQRAAKARALPVILPEMDLDDLTSVDFDAVWNNRINALNPAKERYNAQDILTVQVIALEDEHYQATWHLLTKEKPGEWLVKADNLDDLMNQGIKQLSEQLRPKSPLNEEESRQAYIQVDDVSTIEEANAIQIYLETISGIVSAELDKVTGNTVAFKVNLSISEDSLKQNLNAGQLTPVDATLQGALHYLWHEKTT